MRLISPSPRFANAVVYLPPPRVWPDVLMDEWVLENIDTMAARIAVPSLITILALEHETGSVHGHVCDLSVAALQALRRLAGAAPDPCAPTAESATHAWQLIDASRHYASFDHRHAYVDPELRMRMPPRWLPILLPGVASNAGDSVWSAVAKRPLDTLLSPWLPISLVDYAHGDCVAGGLSLSALHAGSWIDEVSTWVLARNAEIREATGSCWQVSAALQAMQVEQCAEPLRLLFDELVPGHGRVMRAIRTLALHNPAWGTLPAYNWLIGPTDEGKQRRRIGAARANPDRVLAQLLRDLEASGSDPTIAAFLRSMGNRTEDES